MTEHQRDIGPLPNFPAISGVLIFAAALALGLLYRHSVTNDLTGIAERSNVALTRTFANVIWPEIKLFFPVAGTLPRDELRRHPKIAEIRKAALAAIHDVPVLKIKIFNTKGLTVFSTDPSQIGEDKSYNAGFQGALRGDVASELTHRGTFSAFEQVVENRDVLSSYVPIQSESGSVKAVFEIYYDVTTLLERIRRTQYLQIAVVGLTFLLLYLIIIRLVRHRDRLARGHHVEQLRLTRKVMAAEEANKMKSAILANMSHELLTPLNAILGFADIMRLQQQGPLGSRKYVEYVDDILKSGRSVLSIVGNVLDLANIDEGSARLSPEATALAPLVDECIMLTTARYDSQPTIECDLAANCPTLYVDVRRFRQALIALLSNAIKFTPSDGRVSIQSQAATDGGVVIAIHDTGKGMDPDKLAAALTPFGRDGEAYVRRAQGLGLGLPLAQSFIELHGGTLQIDTLPGKGMRVEIRLPARCIAAPALADAADS